MQPYVVTIASEKGGVGKTTLATNLAIYLKALREDLPVTLFSFDNHFSVDQMFRIGNRQPTGDVYSLLTGTPFTELLETGEFGVQFIPSSLRLGELRDRMSDPALLGNLLCQADLQGVVLIDTRPDLDEFTANALYCADRVIVPVKDAPSLENSRRLYRFFEHHELSRQALRILPCLVDSRIRYQEGPFTNPYQLLKAYALNRGYRCMEGFIAKSPKVESLNTNPEGKVYPILTHGRGTEVHLQLASQARQLLLDVDAADRHRLAEMADARTSLLQRRQQGHRQRLERLSGRCLACGEQLPAAGIEGFYLETGDGNQAGFIESDCFTDMVFGSVYQGGRGKPSQNGMQELFLESATRSYFALAVPPRADGPVFFRFDEDGRELSSRPVATNTRDGLFNRGPSSLLKFWNHLEKQIPGEFALLRKGPDGQAEEILAGNNYRAFSQVKQLVGMRLQGI
ncbi:ParA family protein [Geothermobacter hydrogeniphilus]|uniref:ParA family protein n=1 Tax=Geothermobacter hydrogeniphilus TaxID=1969733 RepID=A0A2K2HBX1_9BACT|nr:ParA family protein [Geothermobacter hydrogeniphilus]PNU20815.1 ParA family protein [Geothermobacter hydrogeniphilus]